MSEAVQHSTSQKLLAEAIGTFFLFGGVIGSGVMALDLAGGNGAIALLSNTVATGAILYVLIVMLGPISGAHFNPAVTLAFLVRKEITLGLSALYVVAQIAGGVVGAIAVHAMFDLPLLQVATQTRTGFGQWTGEFIATFGLVLTIFLLLRHKPEAIPAAVGLYIASAIWFTSSTSFANPAITIVRSITDTYVGIAPIDVPAFILAQLVGALVAVACAAWLAPKAITQ